MSKKRTYKNKNEKKIIIAVCIILLVLGATVYAVIKTKKDDDQEHDNDDNDTLDNVHIIFAGIPQSTSGEADAIWPHKSILYQYNVVKDGIKVHTYSFVSPPLIY